MSGGGQEWCSCEQEGMSFQDLTNHYCESFLPEEWKLRYDFLNRPAQESYLYLCGKCTHCWKNARSGVGIAPAESGEELMERVYQEMLRYRPFDGKDPVTGVYRGAVRARSLWYQQQDDLTAAKRNEQFVSLFLPEDQERARRWAQEHHGAEAYTKPRRDRKSTLFLAALELARADGSMKGIDPILDYHLPNGQEPALRDQDIYLTD